MNVKALQCYNLIVKDRESGTSYFLEYSDKLELLEVFKFCSRELSMQVVSVLYYKILYREENVRLACLKSVIFSDDVKTNISKIKLL